MAAIIDLGVVLILLLSAGVSFFRGFIREVLTIVGVVGGVFAAVMFGKALTPITRGWLGVKDDNDPRKLFDVIPYEIVADAIAYIGIFLIVFIVLQLASHFFAAAVRALGLGPVDRTLGFVFGLVRGLLLLAIVYILFSAVIGEEYKETLLKDSKTIFYVEQTSNWLKGFFPSSGEAAVDATRDKLKELDVIEDDKTAEPEPEPASLSAPEDGYTDRDRESLEGLIEKQAPVPPPEAGPNP